MLCKAIRARSAKHNVGHEEQESPPLPNIVKPKNTLKTMIQTFVLTLILLLLPVWMPAMASAQPAPMPADSVRAILDELDAAIARKHEFHARKDARIADLRRRLALAADSLQQYALCKELSDEYQHYQADSAVYYLNRRAALLPLEGHPELADEVAINRAAVLGVMGLYADALHLLQRVDAARLDNDLRMTYYHACRTCYGWLADYTIEHRVKCRYLQQTDLYRDSIALNATRQLDRDIVRAEKAALGGHPDEAISLLERLYRETDDLKILSYLDYTLYEAYVAKADTARQVYYLARTALHDMERSVREYASLHKLARLLYEQGDLDRAYAYLNCSMEDAVACHARLRSLEVTEIYPIIDRAYREKVDHERAVVTGLLIGISLLALLLVGAVVYLYRWMKKLAAMRRDLYQANRSLHAANLSLEQTGRIKEVYIARYLDRCVVYLDKLEQYRRSLEKLAMASKTDALFKAIRSDQFLRDERKAFYRDFDKSFLDLFPHFVERFNNLLQEDGRITPKAGELLNTELRIFALIRLGVTDTNSIAHFLGYSLATVYNYRSKMRNKAVGDKDRFEQEVMGIN